MAMSSLELRDDDRWATLGQLEAQALRGRGRARERRARYPVMCITPVTSPPVKRSAMHPGPE